VSPRVAAVGPDETDLVAACGRLVAEVYGGEGLLEDEVGYLRTVADAGPRARDAVLLAALEGGELLGTATYASALTPYAELAGPGEAEMRMLAVAPSARGRGVGRLLTHACIDLARGEGCQRLVLSSAPLMTGAHAMYEGMGFARSPDRDWSPVPGVHLRTYGLQLR
jgi:ribosomal protein S18 acetylase RimI-like enzyme